MKEDDILRIYDEDLRQTEETLRSLLINSQAKCALLISRRDGSLICQQGETGAMDIMSLAALAAGGFAATKEIARLIGEPEFSVLFHQGEREHIYVCLAGEEALLMLTFDDRTTIGLVRVLAKEASRRLSRIFAVPARSASA